MKVLLALAVVLLVASPAFAQSGTSCCKIDPLMQTDDGNGNLIVLHTTDPAVVALVNSALQNGGCNPSKTTCVILKTQKLSTVTAEVQDFLFSAVGK